MPSQVGVRLEHPWSGGGVIAQEVEKACAPEERLAADT
jgi:hypothetical protein